MTAEEIIERQHSISTEWHFNFSSACFKDWFQRHKETFNFPSGLRASLPAPEDSPRRSEGKKGRRAGRRSDKQQRNAVGLSPWHTRFTRSPTSVHRRHLPGGGAAAVLRARKGVWTECVRAELEWFIQSRPALHGKLVTIVEGNEGNSPQAWQPSRSQR